MSNAVTVIIDDTALLDQPPEETSVGDPGGWYVTESDSLEGGFPSNYNNTNFIPDFKPFGEGAWTFGFDGISVALFGITPPSQFNQTIGLVNTAFSHVNITNPTTYTDFTYHVPARGGQFYTSGILPSPRQLTVGITGARGLALDYALVTVGESTSLKDHTILVDDASPEITWDGSWSAKDNYTMPVPCSLPLSPKSEDFFDFTANMAPHANTSHISSTTGDSFTFQFSGSSLLVSGITPGDEKGPDWFLQMEFSLDGNKTTANFSRDASVTKPHFTYFASPVLNAGNHTLVAKILTVTGSTSPAAQIDYITYKPSFLTAHDKPNFGSALANATQSAGSPGATSGSPSAPGSPTIGITSGRSRPVGVIVGGVIAGCLLVASILVVIWLVRRKRRPKPQLVTEPFTLQPTLSEVSPLKGSLAPTPALQDNALSLSQAAALVQQRQNLAAEIHDLETQPNGGGETLESRVRELQSQMNVLTREIHTHISPPSYAG